MKESLVSIVISTHHRSDKIEKAIKSALAQTYDNYEIIVVDDNSDDLSEREKTKKIVKKYGCVRLIQNEKNLGGGPTRNVGIKAARGELISFLDDDDQYLPDRLKKLYDIYEKHKNKKVGLVYCSCSAINENGDKVRSFVNKYDGKPYFQHMLGCIAGTSMWLAPKSALRAAGGFDDVPSKQDSTLILKLMLSGYNVYGTEEELVLYLLPNGNNISGTKMSNAEGICRFRKLCRKHYSLLSKKEKEMVETNFSKNLVVVYLANNKKKEAKSELKNIRINASVFSKIYIKSLLKYLLPKVYFKKILMAKKAEEKK